MTSNIALMRQQLEKLKSKRTRLQIEAAGIANDIPAMINPSLMEIEDMNMTGVSSKVDSLMVRQAELLSIRQKIWDLEETLG